MVQHFCECTVSMVPAHYYSHLASVKTTQLLEIKLSETHHVILIWKKEYSKFPLCLTCLSASFFSPFYKVMKAHSCRNSRGEGHDASLLCLVLCGLDRWVFESLCLNMSRLEYKSWVGARRPASGGLSFTLVLMSSDGKRGGGEILKYDNRQAEKTFRPRVWEEEAWAPLRFWDAEHNYVWACSYDNQHKIFPFWKRLEIAGWWWAGDEMFLFQMT